MVLLVREGGAMLLMVVLYWCDFGLKEIFFYVGF